ncbi:MAG: hypothetical protein IPK19_34520 [Chloroflexi bacterium]|nr:hypothetical protein [Chloroflexota bacterium]
MNLTDESGDLQSQIAHYREVVLRYEALDEEIDALIMSYGGSSDKMPPHDLNRYRLLARARDELFSEMRALEQTLDLDDDETETLT